MTTRPIALVAGLAGLALAPVVARGAQIQTDRSCYLNSSSSTVSVSGSGFAPSQPYQVSLNGQPLSGGTGTTDASGNLTGTFSVPALTGGVREAREVLAVQQGSTMVTSVFRVTKFVADFMPDHGNPKSLRVRFAAYGFGLLAPNQTVYVHYVRPNGRVRATYRLGKARGVCGKIKRTAQRRLFPFHADPGEWRLQFDTQPRYVKGSSSSDFLFYTVRVQIRRLT